MTLRQVDGAPAVAGKSPGLTGGLFRQPQPQVLKLRRIDLGWGIEEQV